MRLTSYSWGKNRQYIFCLYLCSMVEFGSKFLMIFLVIGLVIAGFAVKLIFTKKGEFKGGCASNNPMLVNELGECGMCGKKPTDDCSSEELPSVG